MSESFSVTVAVKHPDGSVEHVRVGTATKSADGFRVTLEPMTISTDAQAAGRSASAPRAAPRSGGGGVGEVFPNYGRSKGLPIAGAAMQDLEFYANGARRSLADPGKARFHDKERALLALIEAEQARQGGSGGGSPPDDGVPPPGDADRGPDSEPF